MKITCLIFIALLCLGMYTSADAQNRPVLSSEPPEDSALASPQTVRHSSARTTQATVDTLALPVRASFSGWVADTAYYLLQPNGNVSTSYTSAYSPPDHGTLMLDGATATRQAYSITGGNGYTDEAETVNIDLSGLTPADSVYLSFYYQTGGRQDGTEPSDSLLVFFAGADATQQPLYAGTPAWFALGADQDSSWNFVMIPISDSAYFFPQFRVRFQSFGSMSGMFDVWHLDYFYVNSNRTAADTSFADVGIVELIGTPLDSVWALPFDEYQALSPSALTGSQVVVRNLSATSPATRSLTVHLRDELINAVVGTQTISIALAANQVDTFQLQPWQAPVLQGASNIILTARLDHTPADLNPENDSLSIPFPIQNIYGYSDGECERGFGMGASGIGFGQRYKFGVPDVIAAVWVSFFPTRVTAPDMRFEMWDLNPQVDSAIYSDLYFRGFLGTPTEPFVRIQLDSAVQARTDMVVGFTQLGTQSANIGFDKNIEAGASIFYQSGPHWVANTLQGALCLWAETNAETLVGLPHGPRLAAWRVLAYPNPAMGNRIWLEVQGPAPNATGKTRILNADGNLVLETESFPAQSPYSLNFPAHAPAGIYYLQTWVEAPGHQPVVLSQKLVLP